MHAFSSRAFFEITFTVLAATATPFWNLQTTITIDFAYRIEMSVYIKQKYYIVTFI